jgi:hypothetical protein
MLAPVLAKKLDARLRLLLAGRLKAQAVPLPVAKAGPPPHGPDLKKLALAPSDLGGGTVAQEKYVVDRDFSPVSELRSTLTPGGSYLTLVQEVMLLGSPTEATYIQAVLSAGLSRKEFLSDPSFSGVEITRVQMNGVPDAFGEIVRFTLKSGGIAYASLVVVRHGALVALANGVTASAAAPSSVLALGRSVAAKLATG